LEGVTHMQKRLLKFGLVFTGIWGVSGLCVAGLFPEARPENSMWLGLLVMAGSSLLFAQVRTVGWSKRRRDMVAGAFLLIALAGMIGERWGQRLVEPWRTLLTTGWVIAMLAGFFIQASAPDTDLVQRRPV